MPFFFEEPDAKAYSTYKSTDTGNTPEQEQGSTVLVAIHVNTLTSKTANLKIDLFDRPSRSTDNDDEQSKCFAYHCRPIGVRGNYKIT